MIKFFLNIYNDLLFKNISYLSFFQFINSLLTLILVPLLANKINIFFFGLFFLIQNIIKYFNLLTEWGFLSGGVNEIASKKFNKVNIQKTFNQIYSSQLFIILISFLPMVFSLNFLIKDHDLTSYEILSYSLFFFTSSITPIWFLNGLEKVIYSVIIQIYPKIILVFSLLFFLDENIEIYKLFLLLSIGYIIGFCNCSYIIFYKLNFKFNFYNPLNKIKNYFFYFVSSASLTFTNLIIPIIIGFKLNTEAVGIYVVISKIMSMVLIAVNPILNSCFPRICSLYNNNIGNYKKSLFRYSSIILFLIVIIIFIVYSFINNLISLFFDEQFLIAADLFIFIIPAIFLNIINGIIYLFILIPFQKDKEIMKASFLNFTFTIMIGYYLIMEFLLNGAIYTLIFSELLLFSLYLYFLNKGKIIKNLIT